MEALPVFDPLDVGEKETLNVHVSLDAIVAEVHVSALSAKSPVMVSAPMKRSMPPLLVTVMVCCALVESTAWLPKLMEGTLRPTAGASTLVPLNETLSGVVGASEGMETEPVFAPRDVGLKVTSNVQLWAGATVCPLHVSALIANSLPTVSVPRFKTPPPVLLMVNVKGELVVPFASSPNS